VGDVPIEVSDGLDVGVVGGCETWATKCGCGCRLLPSKALLGLLLVVAGLRIPLHCVSRRIARARERSLWTVRERASLTAHE